MRLDISITELRQCFGTESNSWTFISVTREALELALNFHTEPDEELSLLTEDRGTVRGKTKVTLWWNPISHSYLSDFITSINGIAYWLGIGNQEPTAESLSSNLSSASCCLEHDLIFYICASVFLPRQLGWYFYKSQSVVSSLVWVNTVNRFQTVPGTQ